MEIKFKDWEWVKYPGKVCSMRKEVMEEIILFSTCPNALVGIENVTLSGNGTEYDTPRTKKIMYT